MPYFTVYGRPQTFVSLFSYLFSKQSEVVQKKIQLIAACPGWCQTELGGPNALLSPSEGGERIANVINFRQSYDPEIQGHFIAAGKVKPLEGYFGCD